MKKRLLCPKLPHPGSPVALVETEAHHATHVLRLRDGQIVQAIDGQGGTAQVLLRTRGGPIRVEALTEAQEAFSTTSGTQTVFPIVLETAILKGQAMEWVIEKAVELGVQTLYPLITLRTVVRVDPENPDRQLERWNRIAAQAMKQCGRLNTMKIVRPTELKDLLAQSLNSESQRLWCDEESQTDTPLLLSWMDSHPVPKAIHLLIGPEGGWDPRERDQLVAHKGRIARISLGPLILRAETAAIYTISVANAFLQKQISLAETSSSERDQKEY